MDRGRGLDLCTGSVYWICVLCTVYWICILDLCTVYCVLDLCTVYRTRTAVVPMDPLRVPPQCTGDVLLLCYEPPYGAVKVPPQRTAVRLSGVFLPATAPTARRCCCRYVRCVCVL